jgi:hypothetical protein
MVGANGHSKQIASGVAGNGKELRVFLVSAGLEHARRGLESFFADCFTALKAERGLDLSLCKGSGPSRPGERVVPTLRRDTRLAQALSAISRTEAWSWEGVSFAAGLLPVVTWHRPDAILFGDRSVGHVLAAPISRLLQEPPSIDARRRQAKAVRERYSWSELAPKYARMLHSAAR